MLLIDLPLDILRLIPEHFDSLDDLHALILTSRVLYFANSSPTPSRIQRLATSPHNGIQPYPHLFIAVKARVLADWAVQSSANRESLQTAITIGGPQGVLDLALSISPLTLADLAFLRTARLTVLDPATAVLKPLYGSSSDISDYIIACSRVPLSLINYWIYCDLFHHAIDAPALCRAARVRAPMPLSNDTRFKWMNQFRPDCTNGNHVHLEFGLLALSPLLDDDLQDIIAMQLETVPLAQPSVRDIFQRCASHMGLASLKLIVLHEEGMSAGAGRTPDEIRALATAMENLNDAALSDAYHPTDKRETGTSDNETEDDTVPDCVSLQADVSSLF